VKIGNVFRGPRWSTAWRQVAAVQRAVSVASAAVGAREAQVYARWVWPVAAV